MTKLEIIGCVLSLVFGLAATMLYAGAIRPHHHHATYLSQSHQGVPHD